MLPVVSNENTTSTVLPSAVNSGTTPSGSAVVLEAACNKGMVMYDYTSIYLLYIGINLYENTFMWTAVT